MSFLLPPSPPWGNDIKYSINAISQVWVGFLSPVLPQVTQHIHMVLDLQQTSQSNTWKENHFILYIAWVQKIPFKATKHLCMSQKLPKVNVKHVPSVPEHYVIIVAVTDSQDISGYTASCTRVDEVF